MQSLSFATASPMSDRLALQCRRIFLRGLEKLVSIGIHDFERTAPQRFVFDIDVYVPLYSTTPQRDAIHEVVDYDFVREVVQQVLSKGHIALQETIGDAVIDGLLAHPQVVAARVATYKPDVYPDCAAVGVETFRYRPDASVFGPLP